MSLWDALTDIQKKVTEGVEQFQEVFDPNLVAPPPRARPVSSTAFSVDNDDTTSKRPGEDANFRKPDVSQSFRDSPGSSVPRPQANTGGPSRTLATASRDELVAVVQRQTAKIQQLQVRLDESHQENLVLRQERDTLKNMLRASDSELTEAKKSRAAARSAPKDDDSLVDSLKSQISHLQSLISERSSSMIVVQPVETSVSAENHVAKEHHLQQQQQQHQQQLESLIQENQKCQEDNAIAMHAAQQRISFLESENVNVLAQAAESRSFALSEAEAASNAIKAQLVESQVEAATLNSVVSELRTKVCALEASLASHVSKTATDSRVCIDSVPSQAADISSSTSESNLVTELPVQSGVSLSANGATEREHFNEPASNQPSQDDFLKVRALAESATAEAVASRAQLSVAESRICELVAQLDELQTKASTQVHEGESSAPAQQVLSMQRDSAEIADIRSEMDDLISAMDHLSAAVASVNFPNQPALPTHSLPCHLSKAAFTSFKQLADAVDAVVSQLADVDFNSRQAFKALKTASDSECDKLKSLLSSCRAQLDQMSPELDVSRSKIKKLEQQLTSTEGLYKTLQSDLLSSEQVRQALNLELKRLEQSLSSASVTTLTSSADTSVFINSLQWSQVGEPAGWSIRRRVHVDACVWALICSGSHRFWMAETDVMRHLGEKGVSVGSMFDALPPPIVLDTRDHAAANILKEKQIEIVSLEKKVHELSNELQKLQIKIWVQPQHETSEFSNQDVRPTSSDVSEFFPHEVETDSQKETDRLVLLVGDLERKLVHVNSNHAQVVASLMSELEAAQTKVAEADAAARELLQSSEKQLEQQFKERIEEIKRRSRVIADEQALVIINLRKKAKVVLTRDSETHQVTKFPVPSSVLRSVIRMQQNPAPVPGSVSSVASDSDHASDDACVAELSAVERCSAAMASAWGTDHHTGDAGANSSMTAESLSMIGHMQAEILRLSHVNDELRTSLEHCRACEQAMEQHNSSLQAEIQQLKAIDRKTPLNMEYIRNVVVKYIETLDHHGLVPVIATVLQLEDPVRSRVLAAALKRPASNASFVQSIGGGAMSALSSLLPLPKNGMPSRN